jgi:hypothetical protein
MPGISIVGWLDISIPGISGIGGDIGSSLVASHQLEM